MYNDLNDKNMKQELITRIRCILDFMEEFETLVSNAKRDGGELLGDELYQNQELP